MPRFGKLPSKRDYRTLRFSSYLTPALAAPPATFNALDRALSSLSGSTLGDLFPMDGNDQYGDCTIAALAHAATLFEAYVGHRVIMAKSDVIRLCFHLTGGVDSGLQELDVLNYWRKHKAGGDKLIAYASVDPKNHSHVQQAAALFSGVYIGFQVQEGCVEAFDQQKPWTPAPLTNDGHAVYVVGYDAEGVTVLTWGGKQVGTWAWWDECVDEAYALVPSEARDPDFAPGYNLQQLLSDLDAVSLPLALRELSP
jgi:hypothetical protein